MNDFIVSELGAGWGSFNETRVKSARLEVAGLLPVTCCNG